MYPVIRKNRKQLFIVSYPGNTYRLSIKRATFQDDSNIGLQFSCDWLEISLRQQGLHEACQRNYERRIRLLGYLFNVGLLLWFRNHFGRYTDLYKQS